MLRFSTRMANGPYRTTALSSNSVGLVAVEFEGVYVEMERGTLTTEYCRKKMLHEGAMLIFS
jgi:hypothetical protein